ncbi:MAG: hypothetical protein EB078_11305 [Proteobacteria bacterium]|nr:hypothetical protein [Pseudomonadota bacterium]NDC24279.1 hypothetical protein [Pseudomonadota bacterium]NDD05485.1 hypothetical protein [Pseudomonadota bacterium]NDG27444.1 hypothetical protein [Pseudomonadota bacterium]
MNKTPILFALVLNLIFQTLLLAEESTDSKLGAAGKRRLQDNLQILSKNIEDTQTNIENSSKNAATLDDEFKQVESLEQEHLKLKTQYDDFIKKAGEEIEKNNKALQTLASYLNKKEVSSAEKERAQTEQQDRQKWSQETQAKVAKVKGLLQGLNKNFEQLKSRKESLSTQKIQWVEKQKVHKKTLEELNAKKVQTEKMLRDGG